MRSKIALGHCVECSRTADGNARGADLTARSGRGAALGDQILAAAAIDQGVIFTVAFDINAIASTRTIVLAALVGGACAPTSRLLVHTFIFARTRLVQACSVNADGRRPSRALALLHGTIDALFQLRANAHAFGRNGAARPNGFALAVAVARLVARARAARDAAAVIPTVFS